MEIDGSDSFLDANVWPLVIEFIPTNIRAKLSEVSKLWRELAGSWRTFEISLEQRQKESIQEFKQRIDNVIHYLLKHSSRTANVNICLNFLDRYNDDNHWLDKVLSIRTLKQLNFEILPKRLRGFVVDTNQVKCQGLELLNLRTIVLPGPILDQILEKLPNLVELYVEANTKLTSAESLKKLSKLQRLMIPDIGVSSEDIVATCPCLKYLIRSRSKRKQLSHVIGNTVVVSSDAFKLKHLLDMDHIKRVVPLLNQYCYTCDYKITPLLTPLVMDLDRYHELINFLVKEAKFDMNLIPTAFLYQPTLCKTKKIVSGFYPLEAALKSSNMELAKKILELGAHAECPQLSRSFFEVASNDESLKLLLDLGADLHKIINFKHSYTLNRIQHSFEGKFPAFMIPTLKSKDSQYFVDAIKNKVDINIVVSGCSFLEWAIVRGCWGTFVSLLDAGAHWTSGALCSLLIYAPDRFERVVTKKEFDFDLITPKIATIAVQQGYAHLLTKYFVQSPNVLDERGFGCIHYITLMGSQSIDYPNHGPSEDYTRWIVPKTRTPKPRVHFFGQEESDDEEPSVDQEIKGWDDTKEVVDEEDNMMIDEDELEDDDASLDMPRTFAIVPYKDDDDTDPTSQDEEHEADQTFPEHNNPFAYNAGSKPLQNFAEALELLHGDVNLTTKDGESAVLLLCRSEMAQSRKIGRLKELLTKQPNVCIADKNGWTPLHAACYLQEFGVFELLLGAGADINACDKYGNTPLMVGYKSEYPMFSEFGMDFSFAELTKFYFKALQLAAELGIKVNVNATHLILKKQLIHHVATLGTPELLNLIADQADLNSQDATGLTPLHHAVMMGNSIMVRHLIKLGANPNIPTYSLKMTPAMLLMHILTKGKANPPKDAPKDEARIPQGNPFMKISWFESPHIMWLLTIETLLESTLRTRSILEDPKDTTLGLEALIDAPWLEYTDSKNQKHNYDYRLELKNIENMLHCLLQHSDLKHIDSHGNTYLHLAVKYHARPGCIWRIEKLLDKFPKLHSLWNVKNDYNDTPFSLICQACKHFQGFVPVIKSALKHHNINVTETDGLGHTPLHYLIYHVQNDEFLSELDLPQSWSSVTLSQPTTTAVDMLLRDKELTKDTLVKLLTTDSSMLLARDALGRTFLMRILQDLFEKNHDYWTYLEAILQYKEHLNSQDHNGNTALHIACKYFHLGLVESILGKINNTRYSERFFVTVFKLLEAGCDPSIKNKRGETPQDYVPHLHEYYQSLYLNWIKQLDYKDDLTITYNQTEMHRQMSFPEVRNRFTAPFGDEDDEGSDSSSSDSDDDDEDAFFGANAQYYNANDGDNNEFYDEGEEEFDDE